MTWLGRVLVIILKLFLMLVVTMMIRFQVPELRYDFGARAPIEVPSVEELIVGRFARPTFVSIRGTPDFTKAATYATHGVRFTYFLLDGYGDKLVVRTPETVSREWTGIDVHVGRLRPYHRMPFDRTVRAGFQQLFGVSIPDDAFFLARDDVPRPNGWSIAAVSFASILWCVLAYLFFLRSQSWVFAHPKKMNTAGALLTLA